MGTSGGTLVGLWVNSHAACVHRAFRSGTGEVRSETSAFVPFAWARDRSPAEGWEVVELDGPGPFGHRISAPPDIFEPGLRASENGFTEVVRPYEHQVLMASGERIFAGSNFSDLRRCQVAVEVVEDRSNPEQTESRVAAIGLCASWDAGVRVLRIESMTDAAERLLLKEFGELLVAWDPDVVEGHDLFNFDLEALVRRARRVRVPRLWGRFGAEARVRKSRIRFAERWVDYIRCELPGRTVFDTFLAAQAWDVSARELPDYGLGSVAAYFGFGAQGKPSRTGSGKNEQDPALNVEGRLRLIGELSELLLPTYFAQAQAFPMLLQEVCLRGSAQKVEALLLERYFKASASLPEVPVIGSFEGGFSKSFVTGIFRDVLHFDVTSLYPSLLLLMGRNPKTDHLKLFIPLLAELRSYRLHYKTLAAEGLDPVIRREADTRQQAFKILINSFYGYLGFGNARFGDGALAAEVTRQGRNLLHTLIEGFSGLGCEVLEADTDGLYISTSGRDPDELLAAARAWLPEGIDLECDGSYPAMFCYKAKNYALFDGTHVIVRGSALRSRGMEPFLLELTDQMIAWLLGASEISPLVRFEQLKVEISSQSFPVEQLAKTEHLSTSHSTYVDRVAKAGKPRRAALEVAGRMKPPPGAGARVSYYLLPKEKGRTADWQRSALLAEYDPILAPYDTVTYLKKLEDWKKRYADFLEMPSNDQLG